MTSAIYTNTGIVDQCWNSRGLITHNYVTKNCVTTDRNILYTVFRENVTTAAIKIRMSDDNGFSWQNVASISDPGGYTQTIGSGLNTNGPIMHLALGKAINGKETLLTLYVGYYYPPLLSNPGEYRVYHWQYTINIDNTLTAATSGLLLQDHDLLTFELVNNDNSAFMIYNYFDRLGIKVSPINDPDAVVITTSFSGDPANWFNMYSGYPNADETVDILGIRNYTDYHLVYTRFDKGSITFTSPVTIKILSGADFSDINIARDGYGNLMALWHEVPDDKAYSRIFWSMSKDNGATWSTPEEIKPASNNSDFIDNPLSSPTSRTVLLAGIQGFLLGYVKKRNNIGTGYVRTMISTNGIDYTLSNQFVAASHPTKDITGFRFFRPAAFEKINMENVGEVRIAYQLGQGNRTAQNDTLPVYFGQKLLRDEAFPESLYTIREEDTALQNQLLCSFNLIGSTAENIDYYDQGLIGNITNKYVSAFERFGTSVEISQYEPIQKSYLDNKLAYTKTQTIFTKVYVDDINYSSPEISGNQNFQDYIERDTRQVHLSPNIHLSRTFIINDGNKLKRTVWVLKFGGNEYELTQVVPKFIDNQIAYYTTNAYVIGPSRDPFSRIILPSET